MTFKQEFLQHLGIAAGDEMEVSKLPNGELRIRAKHKTAPDKRFGDFAGCLKNHARVHLSVDDMNRIIADAAADTDTPP